VTIHWEPASHADAFALVANNVTAGLPVPDRIWFMGHNELDLHFSDESAVDSWAEALNMPRPEAGEVRDADDDPWQPYGSRRQDHHRVLRGWSVRVSCVIEPAVPSSSLPTERS